MGMVRILGPGATSAGAGFVVGRNDGGTIVTCAHVVDAVVDETDTVSIVFVGSTDRSPRTARVDRAAYRATTAEDVAFLSLLERLPNDVSPLPLTTSFGAGGRTFRTFGFSSAKSVEGLAGEVRVIGETTESGFRVLQVRSNEVSSGFSGAPVWDEAGHIVGVVVSTIAAGADAAGKQVETSFLIPVETLLDIKPELRPSGVCPYRGLDVFEDEHEQWYFGREDAANELVKLIAAGNFVAVIGVSGSGKSSLVRAGLKQALDRTPVPGVAERRRLKLKPSRAPLLDLAAAVDDKALLDEFTELDDAALIERLRAAAGHAIVIVDQFERLYTECDDAEARVRFIDALVALADCGVKVMITLRADFYGYALEHTRLAEKIRAGQLTLLPMTEDELVRAIEQPARALNRVFEDGLVDRLVADVAGRAGDLPLLEFALTELWERDAEQGILTKASYQAIGYRHPDGRTFAGVQGAIARRAEELWNGLGPEGQTAARSVIVALIAAAGQAGDADASVGEATRRALQSELDPDARTVIDTLVNARLLTTGRDARNQPTVGVAHDALIRAWPLAQSWAKEYRPFIRWRVEKLLPYWQNWLDHGERAAFLLPGPAVEEARDWLAKYPDEIGSAARYIEASEKALAARVKRLRVAALTLLAIAIGAVTASVFAVLQTREANQQKQIANVQKRISTAQALASAALANLGEDPARSVAQARSSVLTAETPEGVQALRRSLTESRLLWVTRTGTASATAAVSGDGRFLLTGNAEKNSDVRLWRLPEGHAIGRLSPHNAGTIAAEFARRAPIVATVGRDGFVRVFDLDTRRLLMRVPAERGQTRSPVELEEDALPITALSPDGRLLAAMSSDTTRTRVWSIPRRKRVLEIEGTADSAAPPDFSDDGRRLLVAAPNGGVRVLDTSTLTLLREIAPSRRDETISSAAISSDGTLIATSEGELRSVRSGKLLATLPGPGAVESDATPVFGKRGHSLLVTDGQTALIWVPRDRTTVTLAGHESFINSIELASDDLHALTGGDDGTARVWDTSEGTATVILRGHRGSVLNAMFAEHGGQVVTTGADGTVRLWDVSRRVARFEGSEDGMSAVAFSPNGRVLAAADADGSARLWDVRSRTLLHRLNAATALSPIGPLPGGEEPFMADLAYTPGGRHLVTVGDEGSLIVWDVKTEAPRVLVHHGPSFASVSVARRQPLAVTADEEGAVRLWNLASGAMRVLQPRGSFSTAGVAFDSVAGRIAMFDRNRGVVIYDLMSRRSFSLARGDWSAEAFSFSPDGRRLAVTTDDYVHLVFDLRSHRVIARLYDTILPTNVSFSSDGRFLATTSWEAARIWDVATWKQLMRLPAGEPEAAAFSPESRRLAVVGAEGGEVTVHACPFCGSVQDLLESARQRVARTEVD